MNLVKKYLITLAVFVTTLFIIYHYDRIQIFNSENIFEEIKVEAENRYLINPGDRICGTRQE